IGCDFVGIGDQASVPGEFQLYPAFPNPFNPRTTIRFNFGVISTPLNNLNISLQIFDITGRVVDELVNGNLDSGEHELVWDAIGFSSGVYFVKLTLDKQSKIQKLILLK
ncbi:MAG: T9SS type A sorting domain-containing protein, partial [Candidatus Marinimicrobia bacterium]|nr:T9SS type A sorting domain-containing protein [Candidatus Neomarinimicrobiota bacterium]